MALTKSERPAAACVLLACAPLLLAACQRAVGDGTSKPRGARPHNAASSTPQSAVPLAGDAGIAVDGGNGHGASSRADAGRSSPNGRGDADGDDDDAGSHADAGGDAATPDSGSTSAPDESASCGVDVSTTTAVGGGTYAPSNIGALWVETGSGAFVKTLALWAERRIEHLHGWIDASSAAGQPESTIDAVTSATASLPGAHSGHWDCDDTAGTRMPDGDYQICFELTESDSAGPVSCVAFEKGASPLQLMPPDTALFTRRTIVFTP
jgi:hypothetical protein